MCTYLYTMVKPGLAIKYPQKLPLRIRTFGDNFAHARVKGHDFENGEYLNSK